MNAKALKDFFENFGRIKKVDIDFVNGRSVGIVNFDKKKDAI